MKLSVFASGSSANCSLLEIGGQTFLLDAGLSAKAIREALAACNYKPETLSGILITHEHADHIAGLKVLLKKPLARIFAPGIVASYLYAALPGVESYLERIQPEETFSVGDVRITAFETSHDSRQSVGWRVDAPEGSFAIATDTGVVTGGMRKWLPGAELVMLEANHDIEMLKAGPYPFALKKRILSETGHLSNRDCAALAAELGEKGSRKIVLAHLSAQNNTPELALKTVKAAMKTPETELFAAPERGLLEVII